MKANLVRRNNNSHAVTVVPHIVRVDVQVVSLIRTDGQVVVVAFIQDKMHLTTQRTFFFVVLQVNIPELHAHLYIVAGRKAFFNIK